MAEPQTLARNEMLTFVRHAGARYWSTKHYPDDAFPKQPVNPVDLGHAWVDIVLPEVYARFGVGGKLFIDAACIMPGQGDEFSRCDWHMAAFSYLSGMAEWRHEQAHGAVHSYAFRLKGIPSRCWDYAWVNRIFLLMRAMEADRLKVDEAALFGALPPAHILLTHDVDAIDKTWPIRMKQSAFEFFNLLRALARADVRKAWDAIQRGLRMALTSPTYNHLDTVADAALAHGLRSSFLLHARERKRSLLRWLMDPGYAIGDARLRAFVAARTEQGFQFGLHPSYTDWRGVPALSAGRARMQQALGIVPLQVRQHWLRFSWRDTWRDQAAAGFTEDCTLGFNDRPGFRAGAALRYQPWDAAAVRPHSIHSLPLLLMDSHFYSYQPMSDAQRQDALARWIAEVHAVHGEATVLWHAHTLSPDYGWQQGFRDLLKCMTAYDTSLAIPDGHSSRPTARAGAL